MSMSTGKDGEKKFEQAAIVPKSGIKRRPINIKRMQNVLLIWLDANIDDNNKDCANTVTRLRCVVNDVSTYTDGDQAIQFINTISNNKVCMIVSGALGQHIMPRVHDMSQVDSIFIFCGSKKRHAQWVKEWSKIKGVFTEIAPICEALKQAAQQCEQNAISISFVAANTGDAASTTLDRLDPSFMYTQILKEILLTIKFEQHHVQEFIDYCREQFADSDAEIKNITKFQRTYRDQTPIWWYTYQCFLYPMLNSALRLMNVDVIVRMGFFIADLHRHIQELHTEQYGVHSSDEKFTVYRGQGLSNEHFEQLAKTKGGLISFNNFLSTSKDRDVSLGFAGQVATNPNLVGILFIIQVDPSQSTTAFASISSVSYFKEEDEILFSMHSVFRINDIRPVGGNNRLYEVKLTLTSDNDQDLSKLTDRIREESFPGSKGWERLGLMLLKMGQPDKAQDIYEVLLDQTTNESEKGPIYHQLGSVKNDQGEYKEAIIFYEKAIKIDRNTFPLNQLSLANSYNNIGLVYKSMGDYPEALSSHEKALALQQQSLPSTHPDLGASYNNIGNVYDSMGDYPKALSSNEKALAIKQESLPPNHPSLASSYNDIGNVYYSTGDYPKALSSYEKALAIKQQSLPPNHPNLASSYCNIGNVYDSMGDYPKALSSHEKALAIRQQSLPPNHPDLGASYLNIGNVYYSMGDYPKAISSHEKALAIRQQSLPPNHPDLGASYFNIGTVYYSMGDYPKALSSYEKALAIRQQSLPPNHPDLGTSYNNIGNVYYCIRNDSKARSYYERAVDIGQQSLPSNHPNLQQWRNNLERVKKL